jgi:hypothetical protein
VIREFCEAVVIIRRKSGTQPSNDMCYAFAATVGRGRAQHGTKNLKLVQMIESAPRILFFTSHIIHPRMYVSEREPVIHALTATKSSLKPMIRHYCYAVLH